MFHQKNRWHCMQIQKLWLLSFLTKCSMLDRTFQQDWHLHWQDCLHGAHVSSWIDTLVVTCPWDHATSWQNTAWELSVSVPLCVPDWILHLFLWGTHQLLVQNSGHDSDSWTESRVKSCHCHNIRCGFETLVRLGDCFRDVTMSGTAWRLRCDLETAFVISQCQVRLGDSGAAWRLFSWCHNVRCGLETQVWLGDSFRDVTMAGAAWRLRWGLETVFDVTTSSAAWRLRQGLETVFVMSRHQVWLANCFCDVTTTAGLESVFVMSRQVRQLRHCFRDVTTTMSLSPQPRITSWRMPVHVTAGSQIG